MSTKVEQCEDLAFLSTVKWRMRHRKPGTRSRVNRASGPGALSHSSFGRQNEKRSLVLSPAEITDNLQVSLN